MDELNNTFCELGYDVSFLVSEFRDNGLVEEEHGWLGQKGIPDRDAGFISFEPSKHLGNKAPIQDCNFR